MSTSAIGWIVATVLATQCCPPQPAPQPAPDKTALEPVKLPLKGVLADCCNKAIEDAFKAVPNLQSAKVAKDGESYVASITMKEGEGLPLSAVTKALDAANKAMGESMGTKYELDGDLPWTAAHFYRTSAAPDEATLKTALGSLDGYKGVWVKKTGFAAGFTDSKKPSLDEVGKASGLTVTEVILAPSKDGKRYACPMHPEKVSVTADTKCPACGMKMTEVVVTK